MQSRNPEGYFWHPTSRVYFQSRISPRFCFQIPNPELQIREIPDPEKPIGDPPRSIPQVFSSPKRKQFKHVGDKISIQTRNHFYLNNLPKSLSVVKTIAESKQTHGHEPALCANDVLCVTKVQGRYLSLNSSHLFLCISATLAASADACLSHSRFVSSMDSCRRLSAFFCRKPKECEQS